MPKNPMTTFPVFQEAMWQVYCNVIALSLCHKSAKS